MNISKDNMPEELEHSNGDVIQPYIIRVPTYQGPDCGKVDFAKPLVPVTVENNCGIVLTLGDLDGPSELAVPEVVCERRKNGWCILIAPAVGYDSNLLVYIIDGDEQQTFVVFDGLPGEFPQLVKDPPKLVDDPRAEL